MDHKYFQSRLSAFADGELPADEQARVAEHIEQCQDCRRRLDELRRLEELTERERDLADTDYWEAAAQRIEANLDASATPVTDLIKERAKSKSSLWWKLPAIAASVVLVGYIGLHESDILKDDLMIPPSESVTPTSPDSRPESDLVDETPTAQTEDESVAIPTAIDDLAVETVRREPVTDEYAEFGSDDSEARLRHDEPIAEPIDEVSRSRTAPVKPELSELAEEAQPAPAEPKTRAKVSASAVGSGETVDRDDTWTDKKDANYQDKGKPVVTKTVFTPPPETTDQAKLADEARLEEVETQVALDQVFELDVWRHQRDSLVALITELETDTVRQKRRPRTVQGFTATAPEAQGRAAEAVVVRTSLLQARADLVEAWCRICQVSEDEAEVSQGTEFLRRVASDDRSASREEAAACLESIDRQ